MLGFDVAFNKSPERIQKTVDNAPPADIYYTEGWLRYVDVIYPGKYIRNVRDKSNTFTVEGITPIYGIIFFFYEEKVDAFQEKQKL